MLTMSPPFITDAQLDQYLSWPALLEDLVHYHHAPVADIRDLHLPLGGVNQLLNRAAAIAGHGSGLKAVSIFPENPQAVPACPTVQGIFILFAEGTGCLRAIIDGAGLTKWKTVADSLLGARYLARANSRTLLLIGSGRIASVLAQAYPLIFPAIDRILVFSRTVAKAQALADMVGGEALTNLEEAMAQADIISCATTSHSPVLPGKWLKAGTHVDLIGAYNANMREADDEVLRRGRLFVDARATTIGEIGELIVPMETGVITEADIVGDLYDLVMQRTGRSSEQDITVYKNGGGAHLDLMTALHAVGKINIEECV